MSKYKRALTAYTIFVFLLYCWMLFAPLSCVELFAPVENRELGLIELTQVVVLLLTIYAAIVQLKNNNGMILLWGVIILILSLIVLEETDYGLHYYDFIVGNQPYQSSINGTFRNMHNQGNNNVVIKTIILIIQILIFGVLSCFNISIGKKVFDKNYAIFFWFITLGIPIISFFVKKNYSILQLEIIKGSQFLGETRELGYYMILLVFF